MSSKVLRTPRHVSLRTQQRRLRHIKSVAVRNLAPLVHVSRDPHSVSVFFTIHDPTGSEKVLYKSGTIQGSYNPLWGSLNMNYSNIGEASVLSSFVVRVWEVSSEKELLCFEMLVKLSQFMYLGLTMQRKDHAEYPSNTVVVGMFECYYVPASSGGYPPPPRCTNHSLAPYLPEMSLLEVKKSEVADSYELHELRNLNAHQRRLDQLRNYVQMDKQKLSLLKNRKDAIIKKEIEESLLKAKVELLRVQLAEKKAMMAEKSEALAGFKRELDEREALLRLDREELAGMMFKMEKTVQQAQHKRDQLIRVQRQLHVRQRTMIAELAETFCIKQMNDAFTICDVIMPNGDPILEGTQAEQTAVALGFVAHLVHLLGKFLLIPLQFPIKPVGSRSYIYDHFHEEQNLDIKEFPLFFKGVEKTLYQFGLYLLWRDILQIRQHCGFGTTKGNAKKTLPNLKSLLDRLMRDKYSIYPIQDYPTPTSPQSPVSSTANFKLPLQAANPPSPQKHSPYSLLASRKAASLTQNGSCESSSPKSVPLGQSRLDDQTSYTQYSLEFSSSAPLSRRRNVITNSSVADPLPSSLPLHHHSPDASPKLSPNLFSPSKSPSISSPSPPLHVVADEGDDDASDETYSFFRNHSDALSVITDLETL